MPPKKAVDKNGYRVFNIDKASYLAYPKCNVYMPDGKIEQLAAQGNSYFEMLFSLEKGLGFMDVTSGVSFYIGYPSLLALRKFLETMGMVLKAGQPFPKNINEYQQYIKEMRENARQALDYRRNEVESVREARKEKPHIMEYGRLMQDKGMYDENNRALRAVAQAIYRSD